MIKRSTHRMKQSVQFLSREQVGLKNVKWHFGYVNWPWITTVTDFELRFSLEWEKKKRWAIYWSVNTYQISETCKACMQLVKQGITADDFNGQLHWVSLYMPSLRVKPEYLADYKATGKTVTNGRCWVSLRALSGFLPSDTWPPTYPSVKYS